MKEALWERDLFLNDNILYLFNREIYEYDMQEAGFSLIRTFHMLPDKEIARLLTLSKDRRHIEIGKKYRDDKEFAYKHKRAFMSARKAFFDYNSLEASDIVSIKKDAIFTTKKCTHTQLSEFVNFREKHRYTSYVRLGRRLEVYYGETGVDVKGISDENLELHSEFMLSFITDFISRMEQSPRDSVLRFVRAFIDQYKRRELNIGYYRRFDNYSTYDILSEPSFKAKDYDDIYDVGIMYNFFEVIVRLMKIAL